MIPAGGFVIQSEGIQVYFAGDPYYHSFMERIGQQFRLDAALIPVMTYLVPMAIDSKSAVRAVRALRPAAVIPIHLGIRPRSPLIRTNQTLESFVLRLREAKLSAKIIPLQENQGWEIQEREV
jgi:L-ascorbate metabolism protein UlaG (beta-lactamase superfamily)